MLEISHDFACKWNLIFNHSKSKVIVVGQRIYKNRKWYLGNEKIDQTDNYKYLGVYLSRNLKPTHHILKYLKENLEKKINGMVRILGTYGEFNRVEFGNALWTSVIRSCIAHGCSIWLPTKITDRNDITEILLKVALSTIPPPTINCSNKYLLTYFMERTSYRNCLPFLSF
jgi:hypothetical protein